MFHEWVFISLLLSTLSCTLNLPYIRATEERSKMKKKKNYMHVPSYLLCLLSSRSGYEWICWWSRGESKMHCTNTRTQSYVNHWITILWKTFWDENYARSKFFFFEFQPRWEQKILFQSSLETSFASTQLYDLQDYFFFSSLVAQKIALEIFFPFSFFTFFHRRKRSENFTVGMAHRWSERFLFWTTLEN